MRYMRKCKYYDTYTSVDGTLHGICLGTKNKDYCYCDGDELSCTFYQEKRMKTTKNTAEMWIDAQEDGKCYETTSGNLLYQKDVGLVDRNSTNKIPLEMWDNNDKNIDAFMMEEWKEAVPYVVSKWDPPCDECHSWIEAPVLFNYCPKCGRPITEKGWEQLDENIEKYRTNE